MSSGSLFCIAFILGLLLTLKLVVVHDNRTSPKGIITSPETAALLPAQLAPPHDRIAESTNRRSVVRARALHPNGAEHISTTPLGEPPKYPGDKIFRSMTTAVLLHMGKAGGGTAQARINRVWGIPLKQCHNQGPCPQTLQEYEPKSIITIRDPVDRFVSAFYWRLTLLCDPDGDDREPNAGPAVARPDKYCMPWQRGGKRGISQEGERYFYTWGRDANKLAEALYDSSDEYADKKAPRPKLHVSHAGRTIANWLGDGTGFDWRKQADSIYPIVLEKPFDFKEQIDEAVHWLQKETQFESDEAFAKRVNSAKHKGIDEAKSLHSSKAQKKALSQKSIDNLVRFYQSDYELLHELEELACKSKECHQAIKSMLSRREDSIKKLSAGN